MKKWFLLLCFFPLLTYSQSRKERIAQAKADAVTLANLTAHVKYLASDSLEGRRTGSRGELLAMQYISNWFMKDGLQPKGLPGAGFVQEFDIDEGKQFAADKNFFIVNNNTLELKKEYYPLAYSANASAEGSASIDIGEKDEPWFFDAADILNENKNNPHFNIDDAIIARAKIAKEKGAVALIVFNSSSVVDNIQFNKNDHTAVVEIPVVFITQDAMKKYFADATATFNLKVSVNLISASRKARNVIGYIDNNAVTTIVIGAHYDHLGYGEDGNQTDPQEGAVIHNGADDNASGTAALIEMGRLLEKDANAKKNNYLLIAFSGEELGLFGSKYWLEHPTMNISANYMINMDMVGRYDSSRKLTIGGYGTSPSWGEIFSTITDKNLVVKFDSSGMGPSDHASFYKKDIPVLFFFTNSHPDYHKATDDWDKINFNGELEIVKYIKQIIEAANNKSKFTFTKTRDQEARSVSLPVTLGVVPDYGYTGTGLRIDGVSKGKIAEHIGLQAGDVLLQLGDYKFADIQSYMQALQHFKKGDATKLRIKRGDSEMVFDIQF